MKTVVTPILVLVLCFNSAVVSAQTELKLINIGDFVTTNGSVIRDCKIGYRTVGKINTDSSNVILWPSAFDGTSEDMCRPNSIPNWIDTTDKFVIVIDALANGISSSPSNTVDFPDITVRDMVNSQYHLLINHLNIHHLYAVMGVSMGGMQAFEWMVAYPEFMDKVIPIIGTPKQSSYDLYVWQTQADLLKGGGKMRNLWI